jgi:hypothetical protein
VKSALTTIALLVCLVVPASPALAWDCPPGVPDSADNQNAGICVLVPTVVPTAPTVSPTSTPQPVPQAAQPSQPSSIPEDSSSTSSSQIPICHYEPTQGWMPELKPVGNDLPLAPSTDTPHGDYRRTARGEVCAGVAPAPSTPIQATSPTVAPSTPTAWPTAWPTALPEALPTMPTEVPTMTPTPEPTVIPLTEPTPQMPAGLPDTGDGSTSEVP